MTAPNAASVAGEHGDELLHAHQQMLMTRPWHAAEQGTFWQATGVYPKGGGTFTRCVIVALPAYVTGTDTPVFAFLPPLDGFAVPEQITHAIRLRLVDDETGDDVEVFG